MTEAELIDIAREGIMTLVIISAPPLLTALAVGLVVAILQTLTQIQEQTLTFVPKVLLVFGSLLVFMPFMLSTMNEFWKSMLDRAIVGGG
jgi:flagellar biosynthetic protein FliQ